MSLVCTYIRECLIVDDSYGRKQFLLSSEVESTFRSASQRYQRKSQLETPRIGALMILTAF